MSIRKTSSITERPRYWGITTSRFTKIVSERAVLFSTRAPSSRVLTLNHYVYHVHSYGKRTEQERYLDATENGPSWTYRLTNFSKAIDRDYKILDLSMFTSKGNNVTSHLGCQHLPHFEAKEFPVFIIHKVRKKSQNSEVLSWGDTQICTAVKHPH